MTRHIKAYWRLMTCRQHRADTLRVLFLMALAVSANAIVETVAEVLK